MKTIHVLCTGGTFDKAYGEGTGIKNFSFPEKSAAEEILDRLGIAGVQEVSYDATRAKDSLDLTNEDRSAIAAWCAESHREHCVVIHGTDTMIETALFLSEQRLEKVVILTGSLQPARMRDTDAEFNLGGAIIAAQLCQPGVYIVMSGRVYPWHQCRKNPVTGHFEVR